MPAARKTDMHVCPMVISSVPPVPHVGGPIFGPCSPNVITKMLPQAIVGDMCVCPPVGPTDSIVKGSSGVFVNGMPAARIGDQCAHGGTIVKGEPTVLIGEKGGGGAGAASGGGATGGTSAGTNATDIGAGWEEWVRVDKGDPATQAATLIQAAANGAPFCEICFKAAQEAAGTQRRSGAADTPSRQGGDGVDGAERSVVDDVIDAHRKALEEAAEAAGYELPETNQEARDNLKKGAEQAVNDVIDAHRKALEEAAEAAGYELPETNQEARDNAKKGAEQAVNDVIDAHRKALEEAADAAGYQLPETNQEARDNAKQAAKDVWDSWTGGGGDSSDNGSNGW